MPELLQPIHLIVAGSLLAIGSIAPGQAIAQTRPDPPRLGAAGEWVTPAKDFASTRFSTLNQITTGNVQNLKEVWSYTTGIKDGHEGQPLVVGSMMYVVTPWPNKLMAFDLSKPGPAKLWEFAPKVDPRLAGA